jgi:hypothetical protein
LAVAILALFPHTHNGTANNPKTPMIMPKMPKGSAGPAATIQSVMKNVHENATTARTIVVITKQSPCRGE